MAAFPVVLMDIYRHLAKEDVDYYSKSREQMFGSSLEDVSLTRIMPTHLSHICMKGPAAALGHVRITWSNITAFGHCCVKCSFQQTSQQSLKPLGQCWSPSDRLCTSSSSLEVTSSTMQTSQLLVTSWYVLSKHVSCACLCCAPFRVISENLRPPHLYVAVDLVKSTLSTTAGHQHASTDFSVLCRLFFLSNHIAVMQMQNALLLSLVTLGCCTSCFRWIRCLCSG